MERKTYLIFTDFKEHIDLSFLDKEAVSVWPYIKGQVRSNGKSIQPYHSVDIYLQQRSPDDYNERIDALITAVGGSDSLKKIVSKYQARINALVLSIPAKTSERIEDGYISRETMNKIYDAGLDLQFLYT